MTDIELYNKAKDAYYNGNPLMEDFEFDELEKKLGLENKSYIGARHNLSYTVKHPFIMGSLSKVQIHKDKDGSINFNKYLNDVFKYIHKRTTNSKCIITPKFDGCSFEIYVQRKNNEICISSRGDGEYGKNLYEHLIDKAKQNIEEMNAQYADDYVLRGEVLIDKKIFYEKYSNFVNPRSFVSGILNRDFDCNDKEFVEAIDDLSIVIYDVRLFDSNTHKWEDKDWNEFKLSNTPKFFDAVSINNENDFESIYLQFEKYRNDDCQFALDGIVIKPVSNIRTNNISEHRPQDCVAIKFVPQLKETEVTDIEWSTKKTNELHPVIIVKPVIMDGKSVTRASAHNLGYLKSNRISIGTKVVLSLAGDIIPFIYKVTDCSKYNESLLNLPDSNTIYTEGCHAYKIMSEEETVKKQFMTSASQLNIPYIGNAAAEQIYEYVSNNCKGDEFFDIEAKEVPNNILLVSSYDIEMALGGKTGTNAKKAFIETLKKLTLKDIILSLGYQFCGYKVAEQIENYLLDAPYDWTSLASEGYSWILTDNEKHDRLNVLIRHLNISYDDFKNKVSETKNDMVDKIPVILTGEPNNYSTKQEFLNCNPEYRLTSSWKEVKIVFTNSFDSNTGKMKKAKEKNIEIRLY